MPTTVAIDQVQTADASPTVAPHRISRNPAYDDVDVTFTPTHDGELVPTDDLLPTEGTRYPDEGVWPDDDVYPDQGATVVEGEPRDIIGWTIQMGGTTPTTGTTVAQVTNRCSPVRKCGVSSGGKDRRASSRGFRQASGLPIQVDLQFLQFDDGAADGARAMNVYVLTESQGWL